MTIRPATMAVLVAAVVATATSPVTAKPRIFATTDAGVIYAAPFTMGDGETYEMWTRSTSSGGDPVMHLKVQLPDTSWAYAASNDDWHLGPCTSAPSGGMGSFDACIEYTNSSGADQAATLTVHAYTRSASGTTRFIVREVGEPSLINQIILFEGDTITSDGAEDVEWEAGERLDFAYTVTGMVFPRIVALRGSEAPIRSATKNASGSIYQGLWGQPRMPLPSASDAGPPEGKGDPGFLIGSVFATTGYGDGSARLYLNDFADDADADGLGDELEQALTTCWYPSQPGCTDSRDTDEDGFYDALEVIGGAHHPDCAQLDPEQGPTEDDAGLGCAINLGTYGADPLERDIFVQLNWMETRTGGDPFTSEGVDIAAALQIVQDRFSAPTTLFGVAKPELQLHVDYGQWQHFGLGGQTIDYQYRWCDHPEGSGQCDDFETLYAECPAGSQESDPCTGCSDPPCECTDSNYNGAGNPGWCAPRELPVLCDAVCERYDAGHLAPDGSDPHAPLNTLATYWSATPVFALNRRGLFLPALAVIEVGEKNKAGYCTALLCDVADGENPIVPGVILLPVVSMADDMDAARLIMHELGHQLSLAHAPDADLKNDQPNHVSIMSYSFSGSGVVPDGRPDYSHDRPDIVAASHIINGVSEADCDPSDTANCPQGLAQDGSCNVGWHDSRCYSGGLDERIGIGDNSDENGTPSEPLHASVLASLACTGPPTYIADSLDEFPYNVDWNGSNSIPFDQTEQPPYSNPPENLSFELLTTCEPDWDAQDELTSFDEWKRICDELPLSRQGSGVPHFCSANFGCPNAGESCKCGWCVPTGTSPPQHCLSGAQPGEPTCDDELP